MIDISAYLHKVLKMEYRSSALSPLLWLNALITIPCLVGSFIIQTNFRWAPFILAVAIIFCTLKKYDFLLDKDPRWVQSERFQIDSRKLDIVAQKGGPIIVDPVNLQLTEEPKYLEVDK